MSNALNVDTQVRYSGCCSVYSSALSSNSLPENLKPSFGMLPKLEQSRSARMRGMMSPSTREGAEKKDEPVSMTALHPVWGHTFNGFPSK